MNEYEYKLLIELLLRFWFPKLTHQLALSYLNKIAQFVEVFHIFFNIEHQTNETTVYSSNQF